SVSGTATAGADYASLPGSVTIPAGASSATITVAVIDDFLVEPPETVIVTLTASVNYTVTSPSAATVTIADNDVAGITVRPTSGLITTEAGGIETFSIALDTVPAADVTITVTS